MSESNGRIKLLIYELKEDITRHLSTKLIKIIKTEMSAQRKVLSNYIIDREIPMEAQLQEIKSMVDSNFKTTQQVLNGFDARLKELEEYDEDIG